MTGTVTEPPSLEKFALTGHLYPAGHFFGKILRVIKDPLMTGIIALSGVTFPETISIEMRKIHWLGIICCCIFLVGCAGSSTPQDLNNTEIYDTPAQPAPIVTQASLARDLSSPVPQNLQPLRTLPVDRRSEAAQPISAQTLLSEIASTPASIGQVCSPLSETPLGELTQIISEPYHPPPPGREERHQGVDFSYYRRGERLSIQGAGVQSVLSGLAALVLQDKFPYGNMVIVESIAANLPEDLIEQLGIKKGESIYTLYAHLENTPLVMAGEQVEACQALGLVGKSGNAGVAHLHLEMRIGPAGSRLDDMSYYTLEATVEEKASYMRWRTSGEFNHFNPMLVLVP